MIKRLLLLTTVGLLTAVSSFAEEKIVTIPLLTQLSSTTISGYLDYPFANTWVRLPNGTTSSVTPRDLRLLRSAIVVKNKTFIPVFIAIKQRLAKMNAYQFDARFLPLLLRFSNVPALSSTRTGISSF